MDEKIKQSIRYYSGETSQEYSNIRYTLPIDSYVKYVFTTRLKFFLDLLGGVVGNRQDLSIFEIGCADGILFKKINKYLPGVFSHLVGIDITPDMVKIASQAGIHGADFYLRGSEPVGEKYDVIIEIGVHTSDFEEEIAYVQSKLKPGGYYLKTVGSRSSLVSLFKLRGKPYVKDYRTYPEYDEIFRKHFEIVSGVVYGLFLPKLWSLPGQVSLPLQKLIDFVFRPLVPNLFHEKIYLLKNRF